MTGLCYISFPMYKSYLGIITFPGKVSAITLDGSTSRMSTGTKSTSKVVSVLCIMAKNTQCTHCNMKVHNNALVQLTSSNGITRIKEAVTLWSCICRHIWYWCRSATVLGMFLKFLPTICLIRHSFLQTSCIIGSKSACWITLQDKFGKSIDVGIMTYFLIWSGKWSK